MNRKFNLIALAALGGILAFVGALYYLGLIARSGLMLLNQSKVTALTLSAQQKAQFDQLAKACEPPGGVTFENYKDYGIALGPYDGSYTWSLEPVRFRGFLRARCETEAQGGQMTSEVVGQIKSHFENPWIEFSASACIGSPLVALTFGAFWLLRRIRRKSVP